MQRVMLFRQCLSRIVDAVKMTSPHTSKCSQWGSDRVNIPNTTLAGGWLALVRPQGSDIATERTGHRFTPSIAHCKLQSARLHAALQVI